MWTSNQVCRFICTIISEFFKLPDNNFLIKSLDEAEIVTKQFLDIELKKVRKPVSCTRHSTAICHTPNQTRHALFMMLKLQGSSTRQPSAYMLFNPLLFGLI